jgi:hypothetical protein
MIYLPPVFQLSLFGVVDPGVPNRERILIRPTELVNLAQCGIFLGIKDGDEATTPLNDQFFWFGDLDVSPPSWLIVYTGPGSFEESKLPDSGQTAYSFHWGKEKTVFHAPNIVPVVFKMTEILVGKNRPPQQTQQLTK